MPRAKQSPSFAARLFAARQAKGWTQAELAAAAGLTQGAVSYLESENRPGRERPTQPTLETVRALARALGTTLDQLCGE